jgi:hypothetical protein
VQSRCYSVGFFSLGRDCFTIGCASGNQTALPLMITLEFGSGISWSGTCHVSPARYSSLRCFLNSSLFVPFSSTSSTAMILGRLSDHRVRRLPPIHDSVAWCRGFHVAALRLFALSE